MFRFYKTIEDAYSYANRTLLKLLLSDQQLIPRLRSLKHYFFLSQSFFLTHFLDIAAQELRKPVKAASAQKLQTLLSVALNTDGVMFPQDEAGAGGMFRDDVRMVLQSTGLYEWLLKVVSVKGAVVGDDEAMGTEMGSEEGGERRKDKTKDKDKDKDKKVLNGKLSILRRPSVSDPAVSYRRLRTRLHCQVPAVPSPLAQDHPTLPAPLPFPASS